MRILVGLALLAHQLFEFGILMHVGIYLTIAIGWFSFYMFAYYAVWVPDKTWERLRTRAACGVETGR